MRIRLGKPLQLQTVKRVATGTGNGSLLCIENCKGEPSAAALISILELHGRGFVPVETDSISCCRDSKYM